MFEFDDTFAAELPGLAVAWRGAVAPAPDLLVLNETLATELTMDPAALRSPQGAAILSGTSAPEGSHPVAMAYAGHQFGTYSPRLGDGRALLLGEVIGADGGRFDLHLKGSGRTPFARGGDGRAAVGPMLREYVISEAMHALGIPTTRALSVVATGETVLREEGPLPGAVLARVAASHIRVGTFEYASAHEDPELVRRLADYTIARHYPAVAAADEPYLAFFEAVLEAQASLIAQWMNVGFVHGVMNTDNMAISGETIDYGPCAFIDAFDPTTVFSSIDHQGRYAFGNQPRIAQWNLARLAETLVPLIHKDVEQGVAIATAVLDSFAPRFHRHWSSGMRAKLGLADERVEDDVLIRELLDHFRTAGVDFTAGMRGLSAIARGAAAPPHLATWAPRWLQRLDDANAAADAMDHRNPIYIPRNHLVEDALAHATAGDLAPLHELLTVVQQPFSARPGLERYAEPAPAGDHFVTYCGT